MRWLKEALERIEEAPVPPVMLRYAKLDAEMQARRKGRDEVTVDMVLETEKGYVDKLGKEAIETIKAMAEEKISEISGDIHDTKSQGRPGGIFKEWPEGIFECFVQMHSNTTSRVCYLFLDLSFRYE